MPQLTVTSYALLGFLATRPYSAYELTKQMSRTLKYMWPRAESRLYEEARNLEKHGLAVSEKSYHGKRPRTVYTITTEGEKAFSEWLSTEPSLPNLEFEGLVRVFFADLGDKEQLLHTLRAVRSQVEAMRETTGKAVGRDYLEGRAPSQQRAHVTAFMFDFLWRYTGVILEWVDDSEAVLSKWDDLSPDDKLEWARGIFGIPFRDDEI
jgi:DNA-binding PadR family transcriptional regulator